MEAKYGVYDLGNGEVARLRLDEKYFKKRIDKIGNEANIECPLCKAVADGKLPESCKAHPYNDPYYWSRLEVQLAKQLARDTNKPVMMHCQVTPNRTVTGHITSEPQPLSYPKDDPSPFHTGKIVWLGTVTGRFYSGRENEPNMPKKESDEKS